MARRGGPALVVSLVLASCGGGAALEQSPVGGLEGVWWLTSILEGDRTHIVEVGANTARQPWLEITDRLEGSAGCNHFLSDGFEFDGRRLHPGQTILTAALCRDPDEQGDDVMFVERVFSSALWGERGIEVEWPEGRSGGVMMWTNGAVRFVFTREDGPPVPTTHAPPFSVGRLDCTPFRVEEERIAGTADAPETILRDRVPSAIRIEPGEPLWWWGYDETDAVVAALAQGDITPIQYQLWTCPSRG